MSSASVDVVIPVHNGWGLTRQCLDRLQDQTRRHTVIVVDNGSTDGTPERVRTGFPDAVVVELGANLGFSVACNRGAEAGTGDVVVLLNNDVFCRPDFLERLVAPLDGAEALGSVAALLLRPDESLIDSFGLTADRTLAGFPRLRGSPAQSARDTTAHLLGPCGAAGAYRRAAWEAAGGLDEGVFVYGEDVDLALRLRSAGWPAGATPDAVAVHLGSATATRRSAWQRYRAGFARAYFLRRYGVLRSGVAPRALLTEVLVVAGDAIVYSRDLASLRGRRAGWRAARGASPRPWPPRAAIDSGIGFIDAIRLRRDVYDDRSTNDSESREACTSA